MEREGAAVTCDGRLFHRWAAATGNALSPTVDRRVRRTSRDVDEAERSRRLDWVSAQSAGRRSLSHRYVGTRPLLYAKRGTNWSSDHLLQRFTILQYYTITTFCTYYSLWAKVSIVSLKNSTIKLNISYVSINTFSVNLPSVILQNRLKKYEQKSRFHAELLQALV